MRSRLHPIPWAICLLGMLALSYRLSGRSGIGLIMNPLTLLFTGPFLALILLGLAVRASRASEIGLTLASLAITIPLLALVVLSRDSMGLKDDNIGMALFPLAFLIQWPIVAVSGICVAVGAASSHPTSKATVLDPDHELPDQQKRPDDKSPRS